MTNALQLVVFGQNMDKLLCCCAAPDTRDLEHHVLELVSSYQGIEEGVAEVTNVYLPGFYGQRAPSCNISFRFAVWWISLLPASKGLVVSSRAG